MRLVKDEYNQLKFKVIGIAGFTKFVGTKKECQEFIKHRKDL